GRSSGCCRAQRQGRTADVDCDEHDIIEQLGRSDGRAALSSGTQLGRSDGRAALSSGAQLGRSDGRAALSSGTQLGRSDGRAMFSGGVGSAATASLASASSLPPGRPYVPTPKYSNPSFSSVCFG